MKAKLINIAVAGALAMVAGAAVADEAFQGSWYVMPTIGAMHADNDLKVDNAAAAYGVKFGKELSEHWDVQVGGSYSKADSDNSVHGVPLKGDYKQTLFGIDALYMFSRSNFRPFLMAGLGYARNDANYKLQAGDGSWVKYGDTKGSPSGTIGLGAQYFFSDRIGMQADLKQVWSRAEASATVDGVRYKDRETVGNTYLTLGLIINFPPPPKAAPVALVEPGPSLPEVAAYDEEPVGVLVEETVIEEAGPQQPAFAKVTLQSEVLFDFDKSVLKDGGKAKLDTEVVEKMKAHPEVELVLVTGHTDRIGDDKYNQKLSERRAEAVKKYLVSQGIEESRVHAVGKGEQDPVAECKGVRGKKLIDCLQPNRRVVVEIEVQRAVE